jgi:hypothetical protein
LAPLLNNASHELSIKDGEGRIENGPIEACNKEASIVDFFPIWNLLLFQAIVIDGGVIRVLTSAMATEIGTTT